MTNKINKVPHPGKYIREAIESLDMSQNEFAIRIGMSQKNLCTLLNEKSNITFEIAEKLSLFFNNSIDFWTNLQNRYESYLRLQDNLLQKQKEWEIIKLFNKDFLKDYCNITIDPKDKEKSIRSMNEYFLVSSLCNLENDDMFAFCKTGQNKQSDTKQTILKNAWITLAIKQANQMECEQFDIKKLKMIIPELRKLTVLSPEEFTPKLNKMLKDVGIKYVELPYLQGSNISGVSRWLKNENAFIIAVNDYGKYADRIWFTIFHEIGHAINNNRKNVSISLQKGNIESKEEQAANDFARNCLLNDEEYLEFVSFENYSLESISGFASRQNIHRDIVIGRLEKDGLIKYNQYKKQKYRVS